MTFISAKRAEQLEFRRGTQFLPRPLPISTEASWPSQCTLAQKLLISVWIKSFLVVNVMLAMKNVMEFVSCRSSSCQMWHLCRHNQCSAVSHTLQWIFVTIFGAYPSSLVLLCGNQHSISYRQAGTSLMLIQPCWLVNSFNSALCLISLCYTDCAWWLLKIRRKIAK